MSNFNERELKRVITDVAKGNNFSDNINIELSSGSGKNDGYTGEMIKIKVEDKNTSRVLHLIVKISMKDQKVRKVIPVEEYFSNEIFAYGTIFPSLQKLQQKFNTPQIFNLTAKFYGADNQKNEEYLLLENLRESGFEMLEIRQLLDHEHMKLICEKYGEFHALSFAVKILRPEEFQNFEKKLTNIWTAMSKLRLGEIFQEMTENIRQVVKEKGYENITLDNYANNYLTLMKQFEHHGEEKFACVLHGDCWSNNVMFKYRIREGRKELEELKFVDFQACCVGPPVYDLSYSIYSGASKEVLDNLETYLKIYHDRLSTFLNHFNLDVNLVYSFDELKRQWKKYSHYGALLSTLVWKVRSMEEEHAVDMLNYKADDDSTYFDGMVNADCNRQFLYEHIKILYEHLDKIKKVDW